MENMIHQLPSGQFIVAWWNHWNLQWESTNLSHWTRRHCCPTGCAVAKYLETLPSLGVKTYRHRSSANRAAKRLL